MTRGIPATPHCGSLPSFRPASECESGERALKSSYRAHWSSHGARARFWKKSPLRVAALSVFRRTTATPPSERRWRCCRTSSSSSPSSREKILRFGSFTTSGPLCESDCGHEDRQRPRRRPFSLHRATAPGGRRLAPNSQDERSSCARLRRRSGIQATTTAHGADCARDSWALRHTRDARAPSLADTGAEARTEVDAWKPGS
jgi:hypothetical protein